MDMKGVVQKLKGAFNKRNQGVFVDSFLKSFRHN